MTLGDVQLLDMGDHSVIVIGDEYLDDEGNLHPLSELVPVRHLTTPNANQGITNATNR